MITWPKQSECDLFYGNPRGNGDVVNPVWQRRCMTTLDILPFQMQFAGKPVTRLSTHLKCRDALAEWLNQVWKNAGRDQRVVDEWGISTYSGGFNYRVMRGGSALSMHSYGCAWDFDATRNQFRDPHPHFATVYDQVVKPFLDLGGVWGGDWNGNTNTNDERSCDGMHFQFARMG